MKKMTSLACIIVILSGILLSGCGGIILHFHLLQAMAAIPYR